MAAVEGGNPSFVAVFTKAKGAKEIAIVASLLSFGIGCVLGLVPSTLANRLAHLHFSYDGNCSEEKTKPSACVAGSEESQRLASSANFFAHILTLMFNPSLGRFSDTRGRKPMILLATILALIPSLTFLVFLSSSRLHPRVYYISTILTGLVSFPSISFAALSDIIPQKFHAPAYGGSAFCVCWHGPLTRVILGVLLAGFFGGRALAPTLAVVLRDPLHLATLSSSLILVSSFLAVALVPETLNVPARSTDLSTSHTIDEDTPTIPETRSITQVFRRLSIMVFRPIEDLSILNRTWSIRLLAISCFLGSMVHAVDTTLLVYYVQEQFQFEPMDLAAMCLALGVAGILMQGVLLQPLVATFGENKALILSFISGCLHNLLYGLANRKSLLYVAMILSQLTKTSFPLASAIASRECLSQQGRIQGALFAVSGLGEAIGPVAMKWLQQHSISSDSGIMFIYAAGLCAIGTIIVTFMFLYFENNEEEEDTGVRQQQEQPLLQAPNTLDEEEPSEQIERDPDRAA